MTFWFRDFSSSVLLKHSTKPLYNTECTLSLVEMGRFNGGGSGGVGGGGSENRLSDSTTCVDADGGYNQAADRTLLTLKQ